jgi:predicted Zn finger-like uncharacterized protein
VNYRTTCPQCASVFRLGGDQLAAAAGWVQCGVCGAAFDAHPGLQQEDGSPLVLPGSIPREDTPALVTGEAETSIGDSTKRASSLDLSPPPIADTPAPQDGPLPEPAPIAAHAPHSTADDVYPFKPVDAIARRQTARHIGKAFRLPRSAARQRITPWIWGTASLLLLAVLLAQATYFLRDTLVSRLPQTRPALEQACAALGCSLSLPKNLASLQIIGSDLQTEASDQLRLSLTLGNRAGHAQAWPVLVLTLTDQRNRPLARRSFAPSEYLDDPRRIATGIPARSEQPLSLPLTVNKLAPMGFNLHLVY